jgi:transposase InsO family protein
MGRRRFSVESIVRKLREAEVDLSRGQSVAQVVKKLGVQTLFIEPGSPWENGYVESFIGKMRDELLNREIFYTLNEARVLIEDWRRHYNTKRPHSSLGYRSPAPEAFEPMKNLTRYNFRLT